jgi:hypothetical protein
MSMRIRAKGYEQALSHSIELQLGRPIGKLFDFRDEIIRLNVKIQTALLIEQS